MAAEMLEVYLTATHAKEPSVMYSMGTLDSPSLKTPLQRTQESALTGQSKPTTAGSGSCDVEIRSPPKELAIEKIVKPEQVTVIGPCGTEADMVMTTFPFRMKEVEALPTEGCDMSHFPVVPMNGR